MVGAGALGQSDLVGFGRRPRMPLNNSHMIGALPPSRVLPALA